MKVPPVHVQHPSKVTYMSHAFLQHVPLSACLPVHRKQPACGAHTHRIIHMSYTVFTHAHFCSHHIQSAQSTFNLHNMHLCQLALIDPVFS
jgi:hypothetical protein